MRGVLLCAGFATRMYPLTRDFPKPLLPVAGRPLLEHLLEALLATGRIERWALVSNARFAERFRDWAHALERRHPGLAIQVVDDGARDPGERRGAVRDLALGLAALPGEDAALVAAGDNLFRFPVDALLDDHARRPRNLVLAAREGAPERLRRSGVLEIGGGGRVVAFAEKPEDPQGSHVCPPLYLFEPEALARLGEFLASGSDADSPGRFVAWLVRHTEVFAHEMRGERLDVGDLEGYRRAERWLSEARRSGSSGDR